MAALENFTVLTKSLPEGAEAMAILGDMRELGEVSNAEHQKVVDYIKAHQDPQKPWTVWLVGTEFQKTDNPFRTFEDVNAVKTALAEEGTPEGKYILIKGSNGIRLFELPELL
ncbi:MAG: UDP-N-acetylmuramoyl-tripeptide--D-alanyl-D-alanine ligase, partial [Prevotella sp.]|nr:UDP-N-acetylmuramoyl-tripeptide--D-alanyl-D-alanine ligase [Prevotella sp.]